jgi:hypothetical protein
MAPPSTFENVLGNAERLGYGEGNGCEGLVDFDALDIAQFPVSARQRLLNRGDRSKAEHAGFDSANATGDEPRILQIQRLCRMRR